MFTLYIKSKNGISVHWMQSEKDCEDYLTKVSVSNYKIVPIQKQKNLYFFGCFEWSEEQDDFVINIQKAKEQKINEIRFERNSYFDKVDKILFKGIELSDDDLINKAKVLKEKLRDVTEVDLPNDVEELMIFKPELFKEINSMSV